MDEIVSDKEDRRSRNEVKCVGTLAHEWLIA